MYYWAGSLGNLVTMLQTTRYSLLQEQGLSDVNLFPLSPSGFPINYVVSWGTMPHSANLTAQTSSSLEKLRLHGYLKI